MSQVLIINYELNNINSISNAVSRLGFNYNISNSPFDLKKASKIILPGVGSFDIAMKVLKKNGWVDALNSYSKNYEIPILGICLGMQLLASNSEEGKPCDGLCLVPGKIKKLEQTKNEKIPHVGWNELNQKNKSELFDQIPNHSNFYFVHSYHFSTKNESMVIGKTPYCGEFISAYNHKNIFGVQFHPEKSGKYGLLMLKNFLRL